MEKFKCPVCDEEYLPSNRLSHHHIFPRAWYKNSTLKVDVCQNCHNEFNYLYKMNIMHPWTEKKCVWNWINFCRSKGKNALEIYPELLKEVVG